MDPHFLMLLPPRSARHNTPYTFYTATSPMEQRSIVATPMDTVMYDAPDAERCCETCQCNCHGGCGGAPDTGQEYTLRPDYYHHQHHNRVVEALNRVIETTRPRSEASDDSEVTINPESVPSKPLGAAPSMNLLGHSSANRTSEVIRNDRRQAWLDDIDPWKHFLSPVDEEISHDMTGMDTYEEPSESMLVTPGLSSSQLSSLFHQAANDGHCDLAGIGGGAIADTGTFLQLSSNDRR